VADIMTVLYFHELKLGPARPNWPDRDRFILSKEGHACPAWYACLAERGFFHLKHLDTLRGFGSILQGHPDFRKTPGIDMTTGSLGQGLSIGLGMALESLVSERNFYVYVVLGDGELDEGQVWEAALGASKFGLHRLQVVVDRNGLQLNGSTENIMPLGDYRGKIRRLWPAEGIVFHILALEDTFGETGKYEKLPDTYGISAKHIVGKSVEMMERKNQRTA
jgi:transketolase